MIVECAPHWTMITANAAITVLALMGVTILLRVIFRG